MGNSLKKIGFFGGSFDPIHLGHINLAVRIMEKKKLDQVLFCPANISPTKESAPPIASPRDRMKMVELALEDVPDCDPYDVEIHRDPPSYTMETLKGIEGELYLIVAQDTAYRFMEWKDIEEVLDIAPPLIGVRHGFDQKKISGFPLKIQEKLRTGMCNIPAMDISSTEIRKRLKKRLYCGHLLQGKVLDYIHQNTIYSPEYGESSFEYY